MKSISGLLILGLGLMLLMSCAEPGEEGGEADLDLDMGGGE
jgi:hypothetical protein